MVWLAEFLGCMTMAIDFLIIGGRNNAVTGLLRTLTMLTYFVLLPLTLLFNCSETKDAIIDHSWKIALTGIFKSKKKEKKVERSENTIETPTKPRSNTPRAPMPNDSSRKLTSPVGPTSSHSHNKDEKKQIRPIAKENVKRRQAWT